MRIKFVFNSGNTAGMLVLIAMLTSLLTLVFGVVASALARLCRAWDFRRGGIFHFIRAHVWGCVSTRFGDASF